MQKNEKIEAVIEQIGKLSFFELADLVGSLANNLKDRGIDPFPAAVAAVSSAPATAVEVKEEQTSFDVIIESAGDNKLQVIKEVRTITSLGLKEAKDLVESAPGALVQSDVETATAQKMKAQLEAAGAKVQLK